MPPAAMILLKLKLAVEPLKLEVATGTPFRMSVTELIQEAGAPDSLKTRLVRVAGLPLGLVSWTWATRMF